MSFEEGLVNSILRVEVEGLKILPSKEEIRAAVWLCDPSKALGADGFNLNFIHKLWDEIGEEVCTTFVHFFEKRKLLKDSNITRVTLAPKVDGPKEMKDYRPISMVGNVYKVISKIMAIG